MVMGTQLPKVRPNAPAFSSAVGEIRTEHDDAFGPGGLNEQLCQPLDPRQCAEQFPRERPIVALALRIRSDTPSLMACLDISRSRVSNSAGRRTTSYVS